LSTAIVTVFLRVFHGLFSERARLTALICALVVCIVALGAEAKHSQYHSHPGSIHYLNKAVKMEKGQAQNVAPPVHVSTSEPLVVETQPVFDRITWTLGEPRPCPRTRRLDVRPPPSTSSL
jgi:hypothetical protein